MQQEIDRLKYEMAEAQRNAEWCKREREALLEKQRDAHRSYYQKKAELKALTENSHV